MVPSLGTNQTGPGPRTVMAIAAMLGHRWRTAPATQPPNQRPRAHRRVGGPVVTARRDLYHNSVAPITGFRTTR